jgi:phosphoserine aminotransferase
VRFGEVAEDGKEQVRATCVEDEKRSNIKCCMATVHAEVQEVLETRVEGATCMNTKGHSSIGHVACKASSRMR